MQAPIIMEGFGMLISRFIQAAFLTTALALPASAAKQVEFVLPSGNIGCIYTPQGGTDVYQPVDGGPELSCDRVEPKYVRIVLGPKGNAKLYKNVGDASCCSAGPVLTYSKVWKAGPFKCKATTAGLDCRRGSHGFFMSRARLEAY
jgi:hypothetical protein